MHRLCFIKSRRPQARKPKSLSEKGGLEGQPTGTRSLQECSFLAGLGHIRGRDRPKKDYAGPRLPTPGSLRLWGDSGPPHPQQKLFRQPLRGGGSALLGPAEERSHSKVCSPLRSSPDVLRCVRVYPVCNERNNLYAREGSMDLNTIRLAEVIHQERLAEAEQARQWAQCSVTMPLGQRLRQALSARLIRWGEQLRVPTSQIAARP